MENIDFKILKVSYGFSFVMFDKYNVLIGEIRFRIVNNVYEYLCDVISDGIIYDNFPTNSSLYITYLGIEDEFKNLGFANILLSEFIKQIFSKSKLNRLFLNCCPIQHEHKKPVLEYDILKMFYEKYNFQNIKDNKSNDIMLLKK